MLLWSRVISILLHSCMKTCRFDISRTWIEACDIDLDRPMCIGLLQATFYFYDQIQWPGAALPSVMGNPVPSRRLKRIHDTHPMISWSLLLWISASWLTSSHFCLLWLSCCLFPICLIHWWEFSPSFSKASLTQGSYMQQTFTKNLRMAPGIRAQNRNQPKMQN